MNINGIWCIMIKLFDKNPQVEKSSDVDPNQETQNLSLLQTDFDSNS